MGDDLAAANVNRAYSLAATSIAIFTFVPFLAPSLILFTVGLLVVASTWFALWLVDVLFVSRYFSRVQTVWKS
jgi:hypothetical protein